MYGHLLKRMESIQMYGSYSKVPPTFKCIVPIQMRGQPGTEAQWFGQRPWLRYERYLVQVLPGSVFPAVLPPTVNWELVARHKGYMEAANEVSGHSCQWL